MNEYATAGNGIEVDLKRDFLITDVQTKQAADGALVTVFTDAQHCQSVQPAKQVAALLRT